MEKQVLAPRTRHVIIGGSKAARVTAIQTHDRNKLDIAKCLSVLKGHVKSSDSDSVSNALMLYKQKDGTVKKIKALYVSDKHIIQDFINVAERIYCGDYLYYSDYDTDEIMIQSIWLKPNTKITISGATFENKTSEEKEIICPSMTRPGDNSYQGAYWSPTLMQWYDTKDVIAKIDMTKISKSVGTLMYYKHAISHDLLPEEVTLRLLGVEELLRSFAYKTRVETVRISDHNNTLKLMNQTFYQNPSVETIEFFDFTGDNLSEFDRTFEDATALKNLIGFRFNMTNGKGYNFNGLSNLFKGCVSLEEIDLSTSIANKCSVVDGMFNGCTNLRSVKLPPIWERVNNLRRLDGRNIFRGCTALEDVWIHVPDVGDLGFEGTLVNRDSVVRLISCLQTRNYCKCNIYFSSDVIERIPDFAVLGGTLASRGCVVWVGGKKTYYEVDPDEANIPDFSDVKGGDALAWLVNEPSGDPVFPLNYDLDSSHTIEELDSLVIPIARSRMLAKAVTMNLVEPKELDSNDTGLEDVVFAGNIETSEVGEDIFDEATGMEYVTKGGELEGDISFDD